MSKTDKDKPLKIKMREHTVTDHPTRAEWRLIPTSWHEDGCSPKYVKYAKRSTAKARRRQAKSLIHSGQYDMIYDLRDSMLWYL